MSAMPIRTPLAVALSCWPPGLTNQRSEASFQAPGSIRPRSSVTSLRSDRHNQVRFPAASAGRIRVTQANVRTSSSDSCPPKLAADDESGARPSASRAAGGMPKPSANLQR